MLVQTINMISKLLSIIFVNNDERIINVSHSYKREWGVALM